MATKYSQGTRVLTIKIGLNASKGYYHRATSTVYCESYKTCLAGIITAISTNGRLVIWQLDQEFLEDAINLSRNLTDAYGENIFSDNAKSSYMHFYLHDERNSELLTGIGNLHSIRLEEESKNIGKFSSFVLILQK